MNISFLFKLANFQSWRQNYCLYFYYLYKNSVETLDSNFMITIRIGIQMISPLDFFCCFSFN